MNIREEILKNLNPDWTSTYDLADDFCGGDHARMRMCIHYLRALGWDIGTVHNGTNVGRGYTIDRLQFDLIRLAYVHNRKRPRGFSMTPSGITRWIVSEGC